MKNVENLVQGFMQTKTTWFVFQKDWVLYSEIVVYFSLYSMVAAAKYDFILRDLWYSTKKLTKIMLPKEQFKSLITIYLLWFYLQC